MDKDTHEKGIEVSMPEPAASQQIEPEAEVPSSTAASETDLLNAVQVAAKWREAQKPSRASRNSFLPKRGLLAAVMRQGSPRKSAQPKRTSTSTPPRHTRAPRTASQKPPKTSSPSSPLRHREP